MPTSFDLGSPKLNQAVKTTVDLSRFEHFTPMLTPQQRLEEARKHIQDHWMNSGGAASNMGLPVNTNFDVHGDGDDFVVDFRGGRLRLKSGHGASIVEEVGQRFRVTFEGYGLDIKQETGGDELYGTVSAHIGSTGFTQQWNLSEVTLGASSRKDDRISQNPITIYEGPPLDLNLLVTMVEHDSGDKAKIRSTIQAHIQSIFDGATAALSGGAGGAVAAVSSAIAAESQSANSLTKAIIDGLGSFFTNIFGLGDDPYNPGGINIFAADMSNTLQEQQYHCGHDPRVITYTHRVQLTGRDDGGSVGQISALFLVRRV